MVSFRSSKYDKVKSFAKQLKEANRKCKVPGCKNPVNPYSGPGKDICAYHKNNHAEYGGMANPAKPYTFHKKCVCDICGIDIEEAVRKLYPTMEKEDPVKFNRLCRNRMVADHIVSRADGGSCEADNIQTLCLFCNADKTMLNEDYLSGKRVALNE